MKRLICLLILIGVVLSIFPFMIAATNVYGIVETENNLGVRVRSGAGTNFSVIGTGFGEGEVVKILDEVATQDSSTGCATGKWYKIEYNQEDYTEGYVCTSFIEKRESTPSTEYLKGKINSSIGVIVREGASTSYSSISDGLANGRVVTILDTVDSANSKDTCGSKKWYKISYADSDTGYGYVCTTYVELVESTIDPNYDYEKELAKFPESYQKYLKELHEDHPSWKFYAIDTNLKFDRVVKAQATGSKSLIWTSNEGWRSTKEGAYNWRTDTWKGYDGDSWKAASEGIVAHYLDPRNFLNETRIFMFEDLTYHDYQNESGVQSVLNGTFMSGKFSYNGGNKRYSTTFVEAGQYSGVSPYVLAARVKQEVVISGGKASGSASGTVSGYKGYYNFFNVNAYAANGNDAVINGLIYAKKRGWNNPYISILEGSVHLGDNYILSGQQTLYFQRFNVNPASDSTINTHQYMTNIQAPYSESSTTYSAYVKNGDIDEAIVFYIPIYDNMKETNYAQPNKGNPNNWLSSLKIDGKSVTGFDGEITSYDYNTKNSSIKITTTTVNSKAKVSGNGTINLNDGMNKLNVVVTAENGDKRTYVLNVNKITEEIINPTTIDEVIDQLSVKVNGNIMSGIEIGTTYNSFKDKIYKYNNQATVTLSYADGKVKTTTFATGDKLTITIGEETKTYEILILGDLDGSGDVTLSDLLEVQKLILEKSNLSGIYLKAGDINKDGKIDLHDLLYIQKHILGDKIKQ